VYLCIKRAARREWWWESSYWWERAGWNVQLYDWEMTVCVSVYSVYCGVTEKLMTTILKTIKWGQRRKTEKWNSMCQWGENGGENISLAAVAKQADLNAVTVPVPSCGNAWNYSEKLSLCGSEGCLMMTENSKGSGGPSWQPAVAEAVKPDREMTKLKLMCEKASEMKAMKWEMMREDNEIREWLKYQSDEERNSEMKKKKIESWRRLTGCLYLKLQLKQNWQLLGNRREEIWRMKQKEERERKRRKTMKEETVLRYETVGKIWRRMKISVKFFWNIRKQKIIKKEKRGKFSYRNNFCGGKMKKNCYRN